MCAKGCVYPERLPPTEGAAIQHSLRAFLQIHDWMALRCTSLDPTLYGWTKEGAQNDYEPVGSLQPIAPEALQNLISCGCKTGCSTNICSCRKNGLQCMTFCTVCRGSECSNSKEQEFKHDEDEGEDEE